jgi:aspartyl-tRNA synthetase
VKHAPRPNDYRDTWGGQLTADRADTEARVAGWVHRRRDHGGLIFIDLRDRSGIVQLVFHPENAPEAHERAHALRSEDVISAFGTVTRREAQNVNPNLATGEIELTVSDLEILADAETPPFPLDEGAGVDEILRLRHRSLDLRRPQLQRTIALRHRVIATMREVLNERDFLEIETPYLTRSTPEGARDYLVPARIQPGSFYALPQSPQLFKQLLMIGGLERYYQIARCFRDEDTRADRQPEFTQLDVEMAFVEEDDVIEMMEAVMGSVFEREGFAVPSPPWPRMTFAEAVSRYGIDRPDTRFGLELHDLGDAVSGTEFKVFADVLAAGGVIRGINAGARELPRSDLETLTDLAKQHGAKGLVWAFVQEDGWRSPIAKFLSAAEVEAITQRLGAKPGDLLLVVADEVTTVGQALSALRMELARRFDLIPEGRHDILWVVEFPAFFWDAELKRWDAAHHPFTAPKGDLDDPGHLGSRAYDLVLDGSEIGGGSIRINRLEVQQRVFELLGIGPEEAESRFGFLLDALRYGAPPHGGIAMGIDRIVAALAGVESIRDTIAFPKAASGTDPLTGAPAPVDPVQLRELGLRLG